MQVASRKLPGRSCFSTVPFLVFLIVLKLACIIWLAGRVLPPASNSYSFLGGDHPRKWTVNQRKPVVVALHDTVRYQLITDDGAAEWAALAPGNGIIYLGEHQQPFSISMFHQLRCLDIMRTEIVKLHPSQPNRTATFDPEAGLLEHCTNYVRQMLLCESDIRLQPFMGHPANTYPDLSRCSDWQGVYEEVQRNQFRHLKRQD